MGNFWWNTRISIGKEKQAGKHEDADEDQQEGRDVLISTNLIDGIAIGRGGYTISTPSLSLSGRDIATFGWEHLHSSPPQLRCPTSTIHRRIRIRRRLLGRKSTIIKLNLIGSIEGILRSKTRYLSGVIIPHPTLHRPQTIIDGSSGRQ